MAASLSIDDFNGKLFDNVSMEFIVQEIERVIDGAPVARAGAGIGRETQDESGAPHFIAMHVELHHKFGCMLYFAPNTKDECMSVGDQSRIAEEIENDDGNIGWAGTYVDNRLAIEAVKTFCETGEPDARIQWIDIGDLPEI